MTVSDTVDIGEFLRLSGFDRPPAAARAREVIEAAGVTRAGKRSFVATKEGRARDALADALVRVCGEDCLELDRAGAGRAREEVRVSPRSCEVCGGSNNRRAIIRCVRALRRKGVSRVVLVGGTSNQWRDLREKLEGAGVDVRYIDGTKTSHTLRDAQANQQWAQLVVVWAPTPVRHAVSDLYTDEPLQNVRLVKVHQRGIEALCREIVKTYT